MEKFRLDVVKSIQDFRKSPCRLWTIYHNMEQSNIILSLITNAFLVSNILLLMCSFIQNMAQVIAHRLWLRRSTGRPPQCRISSSSWESINRMQCLDYLFSISIVLWGFGHDPNRRCCHSEVGSIIDWVLPSSPLLLSSPHASTSPCLYPLSRFLTHLSSASNLYFSA